MGLFPDGASAEGLLDLAGNVWEWCSSAYRGDDGRENPEDDALRVLRGGSWRSDSPGLVRCAVRDYYGPGYWVDDLGFRVARGPSR